MSSEAMIAIAFVVDSSAALAAEWPLLFAGYITPMLRRLKESNPPGIKFRVAFVTYGTQDTPLISKNFFHDWVALVPSFRDDPSKLGLGQTTCGGDTGMAALEGFVAALELFDILRQTAQAKASPFPPVYHIFHVAAGMPDSTERPQCNESPILDSVTWESLPSEMKKRNIHLSSISVRAKLPKFSELHSTSSLVAPWFAVRPQHTVLLAGYITQKAGMKRPGEPMTTTPDPKRAKMSPPNTNISPQNIQTSPPNMQTSPARVQTPATVPTPTPTPMRIPTPSTAPPPTNSILPQVPVPPPVSTPAVGPPVITPERMQAIQTALRGAEQTVRNLQRAIGEARAKGETQLAERLMVQFTEKTTAYMKFKTNIQAMLAQQQRAAALAHAQQAMAAQQGQAAQANAQQAHPMQPGQQLGQPPQPPPQQVQAQQSQLAKAQPQQAPAQPPQGVAQGPPPSQAQGPSPVPQASPMKQDDVPMGFADSGNSMMPSQPPPPSTSAELPVPVPGHMRSLSGSGGPPRPMMPMNPAAMGGASPMITQQMQKMIEQKERARQSSAQMKRDSVAVWQGLLTWSGTNPAGGSRDVSSYVVASSTTRETCHVETWPTKLTLKMSETPAVPLPDLQTWMKRTEPAVCTFKANPTAEVPQHNEMAYKAFVAILLKQKSYFIGSWTLPNGRHSNNLLIFPVQAMGLVGAFFPINGIPDMPKPLNPSLIPNPTPPNPAAPPAQGQAPPQLSAAAGPQLMAAIDTYMKQRGVGIPPALIAQLVKLPPPERNQMMANIIRTGMEQRRQKMAAAAAAAGGVPAGLGGANPGIPASMGMPQMGMMQQMGQPQQQQHVHQQQQQPDMGSGFNHAQFGLPATAGMDGGVAGGMGGMGTGERGDVSRCYGERGFASYSKQR
ncbi:hypothetical protein MSAN_01345100 [Mycena sanguinolenta]|uniref:Mediator of RNA polymerase II transcription subunit 25 von Willebrand factor type A domain-containing protein n=1 Tax=Mycena sanguinolenta TaxID=230812 RepID=A0A8H7D0K1_9AGAR|nr:hypothetical protein MSAN_01345100 [Mycena sanguinolenta]